ncbi:hypothetical protein GGI12_003362 [Dipsacomyces acuminosporus]|nr:hypothetical protein GGI12_003362 [Dipsacomyces acuminosporus]
MSQMYAQPETQRESHEGVQLPQAPLHLHGLPPFAASSGSSGSTEFGQIHDMRAYIASNQARLMSSEDDIEDSIHIPPGIFEHKRREDSPKSSNAPGPYKQPWWRQWFSALGWGKSFRFMATYMVLPFVTGVMAGMGEIFANELMFRWGWKGARPITVSGRNNRVFPLQAEKEGASLVHELAVD